MKPGNHDRQIAFASHAIITLLVVPVLAAGSDVPVLEFTEAQRLAASGQPLLEAQAQGVTAARESAVAARQLPDPKLAVGLLDWPVNGPDRYSLSRDDFTMFTVGVTQDIPRAQKRHLLGQRGEHEAEMAQAMLDATRLEIARESGLAWIDVWRPEQALELLHASVREAELQLQVTESAYTTGRAMQADVLAAHVALALLRDEVADAEQQSDDARAQLSRWIGAEASLRPLPRDLPQWSAPAPLAETLVHLRAHPHLNTEEKRLAIAGDEVAIARESYKPDWGVELEYAYRPEFAEYVSINFTVGLPIFTANRQDRNVSAQVAAQEQARQANEDVSREHEAELRRHHADWERLQIRLRQFDTAILPQSEQRTAAAIASWQAGQGTLVAVLDARRIALENRLKRLDLAADAAKHRVNLQYFAGEQP
jgi:outer membrane protein TolC